MKSISYQNTIIKQGFWSKRQQRSRKVTVEAVWDRFCETGRVRAFSCGWREGMEQKPHVFWDSDVAKWMEAAAYLLAQGPDASLEKRVEGLIDCIEQNQGKDGYFNIYFTVCEPQKRFTDRNAHELYCAGHLIEAAVAYYEATGRRRFLDCMCRYADYIETVFIKEKSAAFATPGHEEIELALLRLYRATGETRYREMAAFFLNERGANAKDKDIMASYNAKNTQSHLPVREQHSAEGHAVRACYLYTAMADLAKETGDTALFQACEDIFTDIVERKMYITGGIGSSHIGEAFTVPYDLPNETAYAETCAAIGLIFFAQKMLESTNEARYADIVERALYNGMLSGVSLDGEAFFYENPLEIRLCNRNRNVCSNEQERYPLTQRKAVFDCSCCPPNLIRLFASLGGYLYGAENGTVYVNQFMDSEMRMGEMHVRQETDYPCSGRVTLAAEHVDCLMVRIPAWCEKFELSAAYTIENGYAKIENPKGNIEVRFGMEPVLLEARAEVRENAGRAAIQCGPVVYCTEGFENGGLEGLYLSKKLKAQAQFDEYFGVNTLLVRGFRKEAGEGLYRRLTDDAAQVQIKMIPYFGFANRKESDMAVWLPVI